MAQDNNITLDDCQLSHTAAFALRDEDGDCFIAIDSRQMRTQAEQAVILAHELGHCLTGSFYCQHSPFDERARHERRANKKAVYELIPLDKLIAALDNPWNSVYDLSEHFGVTEDFMRTVLDIYDNDLRSIG